MFRGAFWAGRLFAGQLWTPADEDGATTATAPGVWSRVPRDSQTWTVL
jgi:hypothetical protein